MTFLLGFFFDLLILIFLLLFSATNLLVLSLGNLSRLVNSTICSSQTAHSILPAHSTFWGCRAWRPSLFSFFSLGLPGVAIFILDILICKFLWGCILRLPPASIFIETPYLDDWQVHTSHSPEILLNPTGSQPRNRQPQGTLL